VKGLLRRGQAPEEKRTTSGPVNCRWTSRVTASTGQRQPIELTATGIQAAHPSWRNAGGGSKSREQLLKDVWEYDNLIDTGRWTRTCGRLREKLGSAAKYLDTIPRRGATTLSKNERRREVQAKGIMQSRRRQTPDSRV